jgi:hypothetical protein
MTESTKRKTLMDLHRAALDAHVAYLMESGTEEAAQEASRKFESALEGAVLVSEEYDRLIRHMDAGGDFYAFQMLMHQEFQAAGRVAASGKPSLEALLDRFSGWDGPEAHGPTEPRAMTREMAERAQAMSDPMHTHAAAPDCSPNVLAGDGRIHGLSITPGPPGNYLRYQCDRCGNIVLEGDGFVAALAKSFTCKCGGRPVLLNEKD